MARQEQIGNSTQIIREAGDACPRPCPGTLHASRSDPYYMECNVCHWEWALRYAVPPGDKGTEPDPLPEAIVEDLARAMFTVDQANTVLNPADRSSWDEVQQEKWREDAAAKLRPVWPQIEGWFGELSFLLENGRAAINALQEVAIPSLRYCEEKYGHDDQARLNIEAAIRRQG